MTRHCEHGMMPETCGFCLGLVNRENQTRNWPLGDYHQPPPRAKPLENAPHLIAYSKALEEVQRRKRNKKIFSLNLGKKIEKQVEQETQIEPVNTMISKEINKQKISSDLKKCFECEGLKSLSAFPKDMNICRKCLIDKKKHEKSIKKKDVVKKIKPQQSIDISEMTAEELLLFRKKKLEAELKAIDLALGILK